MSGTWLQRWNPQPAPAARLFCFAHAGGTSAAFRSWPAGLPQGLEVCAVQLPGRSSRLRESPLSDMAALGDAIMGAVLPLSAAPFAFFGHSMGALLASEVAHALARAGAPGPSHLIVSGRRAPHLPSPEPDIHHLPDADFIAEIDARYGGIPKELLQHPDVLALLIPALRADMTAVETFRAAQLPPLSCPLTVLGGMEDSLAPWAQLQAWRDQTTGPFRVRMFPGGHFYLEAGRDAVLAELSTLLAPLTGMQATAGSAA